MLAEAKKEEEERRTVTSPVLPALSIIGGRTGKSLADARVGGGLDAVFYVPNFLTEVSRVWRWEDSVCETYLQ